MVMDSCLSAAAEEASETSRGLRGGPRRRRQLLACEDRSGGFDGEPGGLLGEPRQLRVELLETGSQAGRAAVAIVGVRGHAMHQTVREEAGAESANGLAKAAGHRKRGDRAKDPPLADAREPGGIGQERWRALRMSEDRPEASRLEVEEHRLEQLRREGVRAFYEHKRSGAQAEAHERLVCQLAGLGDRDLSPGLDLQINLGFRQRGTQRASPLAYLREREGVVIADVGGRHHCPGAPLDREPCENQRALDGGGSVVEARQDMRMQVDHMPRRPNTWGTVRRRILRSSQSDQLAP